MAPTSVDEISLAKADKVIKKYAADRSWLVMILQDIQREYNWLPQPVLDEVGERLNIPLSHVYAVTTFYSSFSLTERGEHIIRVCDGTACHLRGSAWLRDEIRRTLGIEEGETTEDGLFTFETVVCLGACALAPVMTIDSKYYGQMTPDKVKEALSRHGKQTRSQ